MILVSISHISGYAADQGPSWADTRCGRVVGCAAGLWRWRAGIGFSVWGAQLPGCVRFSDSYGLPSCPYLRRQGLRLRRVPAAWPCMNVRENVLCSQVPGRSASGCRRKYVLPFISGSRDLVVYTCLGKRTLLGGSRQIPSQASLKVCFPGPTVWPHTCPKPVSLPRGSRSLAVRECSGKRTLLGGFRQIRLRVPPKVCLPGSPGSTVWPRAHPEPAAALSVGPAA